MSCYAREKQLSGFLIGTLKRSVVGGKATPALGTWAGISRLQFSYTTGVNMWTERTWLVARTKGHHGRMSASQPLEEYLSRRKRERDTQALCVYHMFSDSMCC